MFFIKFQGSFSDRSIMSCDRIWSYIRLSACPTTKLHGVIVHKTTSCTYCSSCNTLFQLNIFMDQSFCNLHLNRNAHKATGCKYLPLLFLISSRESVTAAVFSIPSLPASMYLPERDISLLPSVNCISALLLERCGKAYNISHLSASRYLRSNSSLAPVLAKKWAHKAQSIHKVLKGNFWVSVSAS